MWTGLALEVEEGRPRPGFGVFTAGGRRLLLAQQERPVLLAVVEEGLGGVDFWRTDAYRSCVPPLRADTARTLAGDPQRWAHRFARHLDESPGSPLHEGRWLLSYESRLAGWREMLVEGHPGGYLDWHLHSTGWEVLPLRPMPGPDDGRVKAYRKQVREGTLPPVLLWWVSGLDCHLVLDGHARLAAAMAESAEPPVLELHRAMQSDDLAVRVEEEVSFYEDELARYAALRAVHGPTVPDGTGVAGPQLARLLSDLEARQQLTWARPLPGGVEEWRRIAGAAFRGAGNCATSHDAPAREPSNCPRGLR
ncbi:hypothetical protein GCM10010329_49950 [Streptomyces spiroverticillatus]|uniref:Uncharacterized protein n=1 Tax=Streptomyces finlayi TaxID=67296 RepID=A0A919CCD7_9ACTN|nr:hypothetical protein GCM10010329_49950 [Streptomyces spiroverticillatus]GHD03309.1 hypothetical protein GCM10010334_50900 [Streptomyces finlayi]